MRNRPFVPFLLGVSLIGIILALLLFLHPTSSNAWQDPTPVPVSVQPTSFGGQVCASACIPQQVQVVLPPLEAIPIEAVDVMLIMDVSGSMGAEIESVKANIAEIVTSLQAEAPDIRFGIAAFSDYPNLGGDYGDTPYDLIADFAADVPTLTRQLDRVALQGGGDDNESSLRALWETSRVAWRNGLRVVVIFTDAPPKDPDAGPDATYDTSDDLTLGSTLEALTEDNVIVFTVNAGTNSDARNYLREVADETGGSYYLLRDADEIPDVIIESVGGIIRSQRFTFRPANTNFEVLEDNANWLHQSPTNFNYPPEGGTVTVEFEICPAALNLGADGDYSFVLGLQAGETSYGQVQVDFTYHAVCADVYLADNPQDNGKSTCSDAGGLPFWESPDILVRREPVLDDNLAALDILPAEFLAPGQSGYVYVRVHNNGPEMAQSTQVILYASASQLVGTFPADWQEVSRAAVDIDPNQSLWVGPFNWTPTTSHISLRAVVSTGEDQPVNVNDPACDNNIAQLNHIPIVLDVPSVGSSMLGGTLPLHIAETLIYDQLDLSINMDRPSYAQLVLDMPTFSSWQDTGSLDGGHVTGDGLVESNGGRQMQLIGLVGGPDVSVDARLWLAASDPQGTIPISLQASDRTVLGSTIYYTQDPSHVPVRQLPKTEQTANHTNRNWPVLIPIILAGLLLALTLIVKFTSRRQPL